MVFEHTLWVNEKGLFSLEREHIWRGLVWRAFEPKMFVEEITEAWILSQYHLGLHRKLQFGMLTVEEQVSFHLHEHVHYNTLPSDAHQGGELLMKIVEEDRQLGVHFRYNTPILEGTMELESGQAIDYAAYIKEAYRLANIDTLDTIRLLAKEGLLDKDRWILEANLS